METTTRALELRPARLESALHGAPAPSPPGPRRARSIQKVVRAGLGRVRAEVRDLAAVDKKMVLAMAVYGDRSAPATGPFAFEPGEGRHVVEVGRLSGETRSELRSMYERLDHGDRFFIGRYGGDLAFYAWLMFGEMEMGAATKPTASDVAYSYKVFTAPAFRRFGLARGYYAFVRPFLAQLGFRRLICHVRHDNVASMRLHQSVGFRCIGVIWDAHLGPLRRAVLVPEAPRPFLPAIAGEGPGVDWLAAGWLCR